MTAPSYSQTNYFPISPLGVLCSTVRDFVVMSPATARYSIRWCAIGDPTDWPVPNTDDARAKQAGEQVFPNSFGQVTAVAGNDFFGYVFQERAITKMTYVGGDVVFTFDTFEEGRGCQDLGRMVRVDDKVFFESEFGYHMLENDAIANIGFGKVDNTY